MEWNIQSRAHACQSCATGFRDGDAYYTLLRLDSHGGYERLDLCGACWQAREPQKPAARDYVSHWQGIYVAPPAAPPDPIQRETAEQLLRKLLERRDERHRAACYILAVMLERKRVLKVKDQIREPDRRIFVYEHPPTGDLFTIIDPNLQLAQLESVQRDVAELLEQGLPAGPVGEEPMPELPANDNPPGGATLVPVI
jgi:hypothetical protein